MNIGTVLDQQRIQQKRLSQHRQKLKLYCGQLNLEEIPEQTHASPRDQQQILLSSYRTRRYDYQLQLNGKRRVDPINKESSIGSAERGFNIGSAGWSNLEKQNSNGFGVSSVQNPEDLGVRGGGADVASNIPDDFSVVMPDTRQQQNRPPPYMKIVVENHNYSPRQRI